MKILVTEKVNKTIDGFKLLPIIQNCIQLQGVPTNGCEYFVLDECIDQIKDNNIIQQIVSKIRKDGVLSINGKDINLLCQALTTRKINEEQFSEYATNQKQLWSLDRIINELKLCGLTIINSNIQGINYEVSAIRQKN